MLTLADTYLFGAHVYRPPAVSMADVIADLATMKSLGMNLVNIQESWAAENPREGEYNFSEVLALVEEAGRLGMMASISLTLDVMPKWVWDKYPDCRLLNAYGEAHNDPTQYVMPADGKPGPCWDHEGVKREAASFLREIVRRMEPYDHMIYWNIWQEIGLWPQKPGISKPQSLMPFNPQTLDAFRWWLRNRYFTLENLNRAWRSHFSTWSEVEPPRAYLSVPSFPDFSRFIHEGYLTTIVEWRSQALHSHDVRHRPTVFHTSGPYFGSTCEFGWSKKADWYGTSFYPTAQFAPDWLDGPLTEEKYRPAELWQSLYHLNYSRCATGRGRRFLLSEMASGPYTWGLQTKAPVTAGDMKRWLLLQLAAGSTGTVLWNTRPEHFWTEAQGQGFLDGEGGMTERAEMAGRFGSALAKHGRLLAQSTKPIAEVGLVVDEQLFRVAEGLGEHGMVTQALRGCYRACFHAGVDADFVDGNRAENELLARYRVLVLPFPFAMSSELAHKLKHYVERGGTLISGPTPGRFDEYGFACPRWMWAWAEELFGAKCTEVRMVGEFNGKKRWTPPERRPGDVLPPTTLTGTGVLEGLSPKAAFCVQTLSPRSAQPILLAGEQVAGSVNALGKGKAYLWGTLFAYAMLGEECADSQAAFERLLASAGVKPHREGDIVIHRRVGDEGEVWFLLNLAGQTQAWTMPRAGGPAEDLITAETFAAGDKVEVEGWEVRALVVAGSAKG